MKVSGKILIAFLACTLASGALLAQTTRGDIQGRVGDEAGTALPGVTVAIDSDALIGKQATVTDAQGTYKFLVLPPGAYTVTFSLSGYQTRSQENIAVKIGSTTRVDSVMTSAFTDEVVVTSESPLVDTSNTTIGVDLSSDFYSDLPTGRNYTSVAAVTPGAQTDASGRPSTVRPAPRTPTTSTAPTPPASSSASRARLSTSSSSMRSRSSPVPTTRSTAAPPVR